MRASALDRWAEAHPTKLREGCDIGAVRADAYVLLFGDDVEG
jgi:hypothetical protein